MISGMLQSFDEKFEDRSRTFFDCSLKESYLTIFEDLLQLMTTFLG